MMTQTFATLAMTVLLLGIVVRSRRQVPVPLLLPVKRMWRR
ncbi:MULTISPECIES: hypothetical protein [Stappiaceae]|jgi:hypothetical protein|nr:MULTISPECIES: hypothetical protein [Stappiaceae]